MINLNMFSYSVYLVLGDCSDRSVVGFASISAKISSFIPSLGILISLGKVRTLLPTFGIAATVASRDSNAR